MAKEQKQIRSTPSGSPGKQVQPAATTETIKKIPPVRENNRSEKEQKSGQNQKLRPTPALPTAKPAQATPVLTTEEKKTARPTGKSNRSQVGGTAVPGAKSTLPKQAPATNNAQQQEADSYNRTMRRRMQQLGTGSYSNDDKPVKTLQEKRKERVERLKERRAAQVQAVRKSLPGGKLATDTKRVYFLIAGVAIAIVALIVLFAILRLTHVLP